MSDGIYAVGLVGWRVSQATASGAGGKSLEIGAAYDSEGEPVPEDIIREASYLASPPSAPATPS
jgi:hypothetical protein